jgi:hypothetical protein
MFLARFTGIALANPMKKLVRILLILQLSATFSAFAGDNPIRQLGKDAAQAAKQAGKAGKKVGKDIGKAGKKIGKGIRDSTRELFSD